MSHKRKGTAVKSSFPNHKQSTGRKGEEAALNYLLQEGYLVKARNYRCRWGEIDIIAQKGEDLVFVEVRSRNSLAFGMPQESITFRKQKRMQRIARYYLARELGGYWKGAVRFDVIAIVFDEQGEPNFFEHLCAAFW